MKRRIEILSVVFLLVVALVTPAYADAATGTVGASVFMHPGESQQISFSGSSAPQWSSANPAVATVDVTGRVTGVSAGHTAVTADFGSGCVRQCAVNVGYKGIDVSEHNGTVNWTAVKSAGYDFAMIRTGYGGDPDAWTQQKDDCFETNYAGATAAGLKVGVYHYSYATNVTMASQEADFCINILNGRHLDYPVVYDVEAGAQWGLSTSTMTQIVSTFCSRLQQAGYKVAVYSYVTFYNSYLTGCTGYDTWIANTGGVAAPSFSYPYTMWQYAQENVSGVSGACDVDYSYVDYSSSSTGGGTTTTMDPLTFQCDTSSYTFGSNSTYTYKITTPDTFPPTAVSSNPSAVTVSSATQTANGFFFTLTNVGAGQATITTTAGDGRSVSFVATGSGAAQATVLQCDTSSYTFGSNPYYYYKITTSASSAPAASSSNPAAVSVAYSQKVSGGYLYRLTNVGAGTATITTTASGGASVSFPATGAAQTAASLSCDTSSYAFPANGVYYYYKITTSASSAPAASSSNTAAVSVAYSQKLSDGYLYRLTNVGAGTATITTTASGGAAASFTATGTAKAAAATTGVKSDTPFYFTMKKGSTYQFAFTGGSGVSLSFSCGNSSVLKGISTQKIGGTYYFKVTAVGKGCAGLYAVSSKGSERVSIVTVA